MLCGKDGGRRYRRAGKGRMTAMTGTERAERMRDNGLLKELLLRQMPSAGKYATAVAGLFLSRRDADAPVENCFYRPSVGLVVQGGKRSIVGSEELCYGAGQCLVVSVDMPSSFFACGASREQPFLAISLDLDRYLIARLVMELPAAPAGGDAPRKGVAVSDASPALLNAFLRLAMLLEQPEEIAFLAPGIVREIHYRLLTGPLGATLRKFGTLGTQSNQIAQAIAWLRDNYREPLRVERLARLVNMGTSTFHRHFKEVTSLSPLQYHKRLRLYEAQRLMLTQNMDAAGAGLAVGYESPTQFSREYKRMFGEPPRRDIMRRR